MKEILIKSKARGDKICLVDDEDYEWILSVGSIHLNSGGYAIAYIRGSKPYKKQRVSRLIYARYNEITAYIDHKNGNRLDNRKENLRQCSFKENLRNRAKCGSKPTSIFKGVKKNKGGWEARIEVDGCQKSLGSFENEIDAAIAYDIAAKEEFGQFARLNFSDTPEEEKRRVLSLSGLRQRRKKQGTTSSYKGVQKIKEGHFEVSVYYNKLRFKVGRFINEIDAAKAYDDKLIELNGPDSRKLRLNFPK